MQKHLALYALLAGLLMSCGKKAETNSGDAKPAPKPVPTKPNLPANQSAMAIDTFKELPLCAKDKKDQVYYVREHAALYVCSLNAGSYANVKVEIKGEKGATGDKGPTGDKGATGDQGAKGPAGSDAPGGLNAQCLNEMQNVAVDSFKSLVVVNEAALSGPLVAENGAWNFGSLLRQMLPATATEAQVAALTRSMFGSWAAAQQVTGSPTAAPARNDGGLLQKFLCDAATNKDSGCTIANALVNPNKLPFRLLAIINRHDLNEARFVYGLNNGSENKFSIIFEYDLSKITKTKASWASDWQALSSQTCESGNCTGYQNALKAITDAFSGRGVSSGINGNALGQIRTNEAFFTDPPWEFREFILQGAGVTASLQQVDVKKNPPSNLNGTDQLAAAIVANAQAVLNNTWEIPNGLKGSSSRTENFNGSGSGPNFKWSFNGTTPAVPENLRKAFAMNSCIGCHIERTNNINEFYHITPMENKQGKDKLSDYMLDNQIPTRRFGMMQLLTPSCQTSQSSNATSATSLRFH